MQLSHLIGCINVDAIFDMVQGFVQVARSGRSEITVASICLEEKGGGGGVGGKGYKRKWETHKVERGSGEGDKVWLIFHSHMKDWNLSVVITPFSSDVTSPLRF